MNKPSSHSLCNKEVMGLGLRRYFSVNLKISIFYKEWGSISRIRDRLPLLKTSSANISFLRSIKAMPLIKCKQYNNHPQFLNK
jgi:hypothetical protein